MVRSGRNSAGLKPTYRFRIWTRKSYSAFNSLRKQISIGFLATCLSEKIGAKSSTFCKEFLRSLRKLYTSEGVEDQDSPIARFETLIAGLLVPVVFFLLPQTKDQCCSGKSLLYLHPVISLPSSEHFFSFASTKTFSRAHRSIFISNYFIKDKLQFIYLNLINYEKIHGTIVRHGHVRAL